MYVPFCLRISLRALQITYCVHQHVKTVMSLPRFSMISLQALQWRVQGGSKCSSRLLAITQVHCGLGWYNQEKASGNRKLNSSQSFIRFKSFPFNFCTMQTTLSSAAAAGACSEHVPVGAPCQGHWKCEEFRRSFSVSKGVVTFVPAKAKGNALSFPPDFNVAAVSLFPSISTSYLDEPVWQFHYGG